VSRLEKRKASRRKEKKLSAEIKAVHQG